MKRELEKYLEKNRLMLDVETPDDDLIWSGIKTEISRKKHFLSDWFWKTAAIFLLGVLTTYVVVTKTEKKQVVVVTLSDISDDLGKQEAFLKMTVNQKWEELKPIIPKEKGELQFLFDELKELDKVYATYQEDLFETGINEQITEALLDYYEKKMRILNRLLLEIQKEKNYENTVEL